MVKVAGRTEKRPLALFLPAFFLAFKFLAFKIFA
jgi:hypothetical protein